jgi:hypothetical protein
MEEQHLEIRSSHEEQSQLILGSSQIEEQNPPNNKIDLSASEILPNKSRYWIKDNLATECFACKGKFSMWNRKSHCRYCGNIFCRKCLNKSIIIPKFITDKPKAEDTWNISYYVPITDEEKVCNVCYDDIKKKVAIHEKIKKLMNNPIPLNILRESTEFTDEEKMYYYENFRNIQYNLPNHIYHINEKKLLSVNANLLVGHSKYLTQFMKSIDWASINSAHIPKFLQLLQTSKKKISCQELFCTRTCGNKISYDDCINILSSTISVLPDAIIDFLFSIMQNTTPEIITCHIPFFAGLVRKYSHRSNIKNSLFQILSVNIKIIYYSYWFLNIEKGNCVNIDEMENINKFIELYPNNLVFIMQKEYFFYKGIIDCFDDVTGYLRKYFHIHRPISLPYNPEIKLIDVDFNNIIIKDSKTHPIIIPFTTTKGKVRLLFKKENIMNDIIVLNLMTLTDIILRENLDINFNIIVYPLIPLTSNSGIIEIIENAETVYTINEHLDKSILEFIIENNENKVIGDVLDKYMYSLVSYTLHSYFLGLRDRHLHNIMVTHDGCIFHIDFGFILGIDTFFITESEMSFLSGSEIKLNKDMLSVIGSNNRYKSYLNLCCQGIVVIRKYFHIFFILLCQDKNFSLDHIEKFILSRFQPKCDDDKIVMDLLKIIEKSNGNFASWIRDYIHYYSQEKTIQNSFRYMFKTAYDMFKGLTGSK